MRSRFHRLALCVALFALARPAESLASEAAAEGVRFAPPPGFERLDDALFAGTRALVPAISGEPAREVVAVFAEAGVERPASLSIGRVAAPLELARAARAAPSAIAAHFRGELDLEVTVDHPSIVEGPHGARVEVRARPKLEEARVVRFAFVPGGEGYSVLAASYPAARGEELDPLLTRAFDSFEARPAPAPTRERTLAFRAAGFGAAGVLVVVALRLWRRRQTR